LREQTAQVRTCTIIVSFWRTVSLWHIIFNNSIRFRSRI
jgi:hypothetical protein